MEQEDFIKRQIDQLGRVLVKVLAGLTGLDASGQSGESIETIDLMLKNELDIDLDTLLSMPEDKFIMTLQTSGDWSHGNAEMLADIMFILAEEGDFSRAMVPRQEKLYKHALAVYQYVDRTCLTYSFERQRKLEKIKSIFLHGS